MANPITPNVSGPPQVAVGSIEEGMVVPSVPLLSLMDARLRSLEIQLMRSEEARAELKASLMAIINERDARYTERFESSNIALAAALSAQKEAVAAALSAADRAVLKAEIAAEKRFDGVNEFRQTLADQQRTLMPRSEVEVINKAMTDKIDLLTAGWTQLRTAKAVNTEWIGYALGAAGILYGIFKASGH